MKRFEQSSALGMWDFAAYVLSEDASVANNVAHSYLALTLGEESYMSKSAINIWRGNVEDQAEQAKEICKYLKMLRHPVFGLDPNVILKIHDNKIEIGEHNYIGNDCLLAALEGTRISIGSNCMIASPCEIRTSDSHSLLDSDGRRINYAKDIVLGGHVWIGMGCLILKGAYIPENCVVAAKSVVCSMKNVNKGSLLGGTPARILKENINWNHKRIK